jgi:hypothetical protein
MMMLMIIIAMMTNKYFQSSNDTHFQAKMPIIFRLYWLKISEFKTFSILASNLEVNLNREENFPRSEQHS